MYYKVLKDNKVVDILDRIIYVKYQEKNDLILLCGPEEAEAILSSDGNYAWHIEGLYHYKPDNELSSIVEITKHEYNQRKSFGGLTREELVDAYTLELLEGGIL